jgi:hypothetical protein
MEDVVQNSIHYMDQAVVEAVEQVSHQVTKQLQETDHVAPEEEPMHQILLTEQEAMVDMGCSYSNTIVLVVAVTAATYLL